MFEVLVKARLPRAEKAQRRSRGAAAADAAGPRGLRIGIPDARLLATVVPPVRRAFSSAVDATYHLRRFGDRGDYRSGIASAIRAGAEISARDYLDAQRARARAGRVIDAAFDHVDVRALPTMAIEPPPVGAERVARSRS